MYYLYYGIWYGVKSRLSQRVITFIYFGLLGLVVMVGLAMMITSLVMLGVF